MPVCVHRVVFQVDRLAHALPLLLLLQLPLSSAGVCGTQPPADILCHCTFCADLHFNRTPHLPCHCCCCCRPCRPLQVSAEHSLQLQPLERVVTVAWQNIQQGPPLEPYQAAAAILTTQVRLLLQDVCCQCDCWTTACCLAPLPCRTSFPPCLCTLLSWLACPKPSASSLLHLTQDMWCSGPARMLPRPPHTPDLFYLLSLSHSPPPPCPLQRLLLVSGDLSVLASIDASCGSVGLASGISSLLWVGPALLYMTAAGQVSEAQQQGTTCCYCCYGCCRQKGRRGTLCMGRPAQHSAALECRLTTRCCWELSKDELRKCTRDVYFRLFMAAFSPCR